MQALATCPDFPAPRKNSKDTHSDLRCSRPSATFRGEGHEMDESTAVEIDEPEDWALAERLLLGALINVWPILHWLLRQVLHFVLESQWLAPRCRNFSARIEQNDDQGLLLQRQGK